jgi:hypothetical protein
LVVGCGELAPVPPDASMDASAPPNDDATVDVSVVQDGTDDMEEDDTETADAGGIVLASKQGAPFAIVVDSENVYWTNTFGNDWLMKCAIGGCNDSPTVLSTGNFSQTGLAIYGTMLYSAHYGVAACSTSGCAKPTILSTAGDAWMIATDGTTLYWTVGGGVMSCSVDGCNGSSSLFAPQGAYGIALDGTDVYWADPGNGAIRKAPRGGGTASVFTSSYAAFVVALDDANVYWGTGDANGMIMECAKTDCSTPIVLATNQNQPYAIASDGTNVYWVTTGDAHVPLNGTVMRCAVGGCGGAPTALATNQLYPTGIAVDATSVYWTNYNGGTVMKLPK